MDAPEVPPTRRARPRPPWLRDAEHVDVAVYAAVAQTVTPALDRAMGRLARAADGSRLWMGAAAVLAASRGPRGRHAAGLGLASIAATSVVVNAAAKPLVRRHRPDRDEHGVPLARHVPMPRSRSLPSGHAASAFAFATGVGAVLPRDAVAVRGLAALVAYSRVHTGVHFPGDVILGSLLGTAVADAVVHADVRRLGR
ncbi:MAG: phosphatase PAP2 family protein [Solirubrobacterales bacterium]|nr:phosphatase PAP2 family protein [Solirubrobacterales bacterium]